MPADIRPIYETPESQAAEQEMVEHLCRVWRCEVRKLPRAYRLDYAAIRDNQIVAWLELKERFRTLAEHRCMFLSLQKVIGGRELVVAGGDKPCLFVARCTDGYFYVDFLKQPYPVEFRGRTDRNDWQDQEPVIAIPTADFKPVPSPW